MGIAFFINLGLVAVAVELVFSSKISIDARQVAAGQKESFEFAEHHISCKSFSSSIEQCI